MAASVQVLLTVDIRGEMATRRTGAARICGVCSQDTWPPDVTRSGASRHTRYMHDACAAADAVSQIRDAGHALTAPTPRDSSGRELRVIRP